MYFKIKQKLKNAFFTYVQFSNLMFKSLFFNDYEIFRMFIIIKNNKKVLFAIFINDHEVFFSNIRKHVRIFVYKIFISLYV